MRLGTTVVAGDLQGIISREKKAQSEVCVR